MKSIYALIFFLCCSGVLHAQVGIGTTTPNANAVLELKSPGNNQGFLVPRLSTAQRSALSLTSAENGLLVYDSDENRFYYWQVSQWLPIRSGDDVSLNAGAGIEITGNTVSAIPDGDGDATNEIQDLQLTGNNLQITNNGSATVIDLTPFTDGDGDATNEIQDLQMVGNTLKITNNASATEIDLAPFAGTNTDNQTLTYDATTGALDITGGNTVTVTPAGAAGGVLTGNYPDPGLVDNAVTTTKINNLAVTTGKINDLAVTNAKIANDAINSAKISDGTVTSADMSTTGVTAGTYGNATSVPQFAVDSKGRITTATTVTISGTLPGGTAGGVLTGTYPNPGLADNAVTTTKINDLAVTTAKVNDLAVTNAKIANDAITSAKILDGTITSADLSTSGVTAQTYGTATTVPQFAVDSKGRITSAANVTIAGTSPGGAAGGVLTGTYPDPGLADDAVSTTKISNLAITTAKINTAAVTDAKLSTTGVVANSYGSATQIPTFTVNAQGRLTAAGSVTIAGSSPEGLAETLGTSPDAQNEPAYNLSSVSIGNWGGKGPGPGALNVVGSHFVNFTMVDDGYTVQPTDYILVGNIGSAKPVNIILPEAGLNKGRILIIRSQAPNATEGVIVRAKETIDGQSTSETLYIDPNFSNNTAYAITLLSTGTEWITISRSIGKSKG